MKLLAPGFLTYSRLLTFFLVALLLWKGGKSVDATWAFGGLAVLLTVYGSIDRELKKLRLPTWFQVLWIGYLALSVISFYLSASQNYGLDEIIRDTAAYLCSAFAWRFGSRYGQDARRSVGQALTVALLAACAIGVVVYTFQPVNRFVGSFFDPRFHTDYWPNAWAQAVLLLWPMAAWFLRGKKPVVQGLVLGIISGALLLSYSRGGMLAGMGQVALGTVLLAPVFFSPKRALSLATSLTIAVLIALSTFFAANALRQTNFPVQSVIEKATFKAAEGTSSISERRQFWGQAAFLAAERPWFGWGPYSFRFVQPRLQTGVYETSDHAHNLFLKSAMERGLPATLLLVALLTTLLVMVARNARTERDGFAVAVAIAVAGVLAHSLIDYNLQFVGIALPFWFLLGLAAAGERTLAPQHAMPSEQAIALALFAVLIWEGIFLTTSSIGRRFDARGDDARAAVFYEMSASQRYSRDLALAHSLLHLRQGQTEAAEAVADRALTENAEDARVWQLLADVARAKGEYDYAAQLYYRAYNLAPMNYLSPLVGFLELTADDPRRRGYFRQPQVRAQLLATVELYSDAIVRNSHFIALSDTVELLERAVDFLSRVYPDAAQELQSSIAPALENAAYERLRLDAQPKGMLW